MTKLFSTYISIIIILVILSGCRNRGAGTDDLPTPITPDAYATAIVLTENAPPPGFEQISFPKIDDNLRQLSGWRYEMQMSFEGVFAGTPRQTQAETRATVWFNQVASARRVVLQTEGDLLGQAESIQLEAVRLGPDAFLLRDGVCLSNAEDDAEVAADIGAGTIIGGIKLALPAAQEAVINNQQVWRYGVNFDQLNLPNVIFGDNARILALNSELWFAPEHDVVVRYYLTMEVEGANVLGSTLPVTGTVIIRYDLYDIGEVPNISVPFGC